MATRLERANAIRFLSIDAVERAKSGHPGMPMGMADIAEVLWHDFLRFNPLNPNWFNRDRFILSNGHGSMLQYALLHLTGFAVSLEDLQAFRQLHSKTPGHPEYGFTPGVETTTGPLGQGLANAVGMALAHQHLAAQFNRPAFPIVDHHIYCFVGDGCLMEGISHEVASLAGTLGLGRLIVIYDDNHISIDGKVDAWFRDNTPQRFEAYGWHVVADVDGHNSEAIHQAILAAQAVDDRPSLICCRTQIGFGAPNVVGTAKIHGSPLGASEIAATREALQWPHPPFVIPADIYASWDKRKQGGTREAAWQTLFAGYQAEYPELAAEFTRRFAGKLPADFAEVSAALIQTLNAKQQTLATRQASQACLNHYAPILPELIGGSADLTESNGTHWQGMSIFSRETPAGRYVHYGVREFGMSAMLNGLSLGYGLIPFGGTFLTFSDYARNAIRLSAMMQTRAIFVYTHDSIGLGEDGPTHQPIEQLASLRMIPGLALFRPCDTVETAVAWQQALQRLGPTCLVLSRQALPFQTRTPAQIEAIAKGGYILRDTTAVLDAILIATGSEVALAVAAAEALAAEGVHVRVVSMPSVDQFLAQTLAYREAVLPTHTPKVAVEAALGLDWHQFVGVTGAVVHLATFGESAPGPEIFKERGFTVENVVTVVQQTIKRRLS